LLQILELPVFFLQNLLQILSVFLHPPSRPHITMSYIILESHSISYTCR
jgi:hypothetical protein